MRYLHLRFWGSELKIIETDGENEIKKMVISGKEVMNLEAKIYTSDTQGFRGQQK